MSEFGDWGDRRPAPGSQVLVGAGQQQAVGSGPILVHCGQAAHGQGPLLAVENNHDGIGQDFLADDADAAQVADHSAFLARLEGAVVDDGQGTISGAGNPLELQLCDGDRGIGWDDDSGSDVPFGIREERVSSFLRRCRINEDRLGRLWLRWRGFG